MKTRKKSREYVLDKKKNQFEANTKCCQTTWD